MYLHWAKKGNLIFKVGCDIVLPKAFATECYYMALACGWYNARFDWLIVTEYCRALFSRNAHGPIMDYAN